MQPCTNQDLMNALNQYEGGLKNLRRRIDSLESEIMKPSTGASFGGGGDGAEFFRALQNSGICAKFLQSPGTHIFQADGHIWGNPPLRAPEMKTITATALGYPTPGIMQIERVADEIVKPATRRLRVRDLV